MGKAPAFQLYASDFLEGTSEFSAEEVGVFVRLLCNAWNKGPLSKDPARLANMSGVSPARFARLWVAVGAKWVEIDTGYINLKLEETRAVKQTFSSTHAAANGRLGGLAKAANLASQSASKNASIATVNSVSKELATPSEALARSSSSVFDLQSSDQTLDQDQPADAAPVHAVLVKLAHTVLDDIDAGSLDIGAKDALKDRAARARLAYDSGAITKALDSAETQRRLRRRA